MRNIVTVAAAWAATTVLTSATPSLGAWITEPPAKNPRFAHNPHNTTDNWTVSGLLLSGLFILTAACCICLMCRHRENPSDRQSDTAQRFFSDPNTAPIDVAIQIAQPASAQ